MQCQSKTQFMKKQSLIFKRSENPIFCVVYSAAATLISLVWGAILVYGEGMEFKYLNHFCGLRAEQAVFLLEICQVLDLDP